MGTRQDDRPFQKVKSWAATEGLWSFKGEKARYLKPDRPDYAVGTAHTDIRASDVAVRFGVRFEIIPDTPTRVNATAAGVILGIGGMERRDAVVGLGGGGGAYSLTQFKAGRGYVPVLQLGTLANLHRRQRYQVEVIQRGQMITLSVDRVRVFDAVLPEPLLGNQIGVRAWGPDSVEFSDVEVRQSRPTLFVAMQFSEPYETIYRKVIKPAGEKSGFDVYEIRDLKRPGVIFQEIQQELGKATAVVAEISSANENVFYELGYAHALNKRTVLLAQNGIELPFDVRSYRVIFYDNTIGGEAKLEESFGEYLAAILGET